MGRTATFSTADVVTAARDLFWAKGYDAASITDIEEATGLGRSSVYHAFGSKRGLFDATVEDYLATVVRPRLRLLQADGAGAAALHGYLDGLAVAIRSLPADDAAKGCLLLNSAAGIASRDEVVGAVVDGYRAELTAALLHALTGAVRDAAADGSAPTGAAADHALALGARLLASMVISAMVVARVNAAESAEILASASELVDDRVAAVMAAAA